MPARPTSARAQNRTFAVMRIVISVLTRCVMSAGGCLIWTPMKMAPAAAAQRPAVAVRWSLLMFTADSFGLGAGRGVRRCRQLRSRCGERTSHDDVIEGGDCAAVTLRERRGPGLDVRR